MGTAISALFSSVTTDVADSIFDPSADVTRRSVRVFDAADFEMLFAPAECIQLAPGNFTGTWETAQAGMVTVSQQTCNAAFQLRKTVAPDLGMIGFIKRGTMIKEHARLWKPKNLIATVGGELNLSTLAPAQIVWIDFPCRMLTPAAQRALTGARSQPLFLEVTQTALDKLAWCAGRLLNNSPSAQSDRLDLTILLENVLKTAGAITMESKRKRHSFFLAEQVVRFMWENVDQHLTLKIICERLHCKTRKLIYSFTDSFGMGPMQYLKILRLNAAHRELNCACGDARIFDVAADFGFWHMGHFGADYKHMFGTTASETIKAARRRARSADRMCRVRFWDGSSPYPLVVL